MTPREIATFIFESWQPREYPPAEKLFLASCWLLAQEKRRRIVERGVKWLEQMIWELHRGFHRAGMF